MSASFSLDKNALNRASQPSLFGYITNSNENAGEHRTHPLQRRLLVRKVARCRSLGLRQQRSARGVLRHRVRGAAARAYGDWQLEIFLAPGDHNIVSGAFHIGYYILMIVAPFPHLRIPHVLSPSVYAGWVVCTLFCSNPLMLALAYSFDQPNDRFSDRSDHARSRDCFVRLRRYSRVGETPQNFRHTFYRHYTLAMHVRNYVWNEQTTVKIDGDAVTGCTRELDARI